MLLWAWLKDVGVEKSLRVTVLEGISHRPHEGASVLHGASHRCTSTSWIWAAFL